MNDQYTYARFWRCALQVNSFHYNGAYRGNDHGFSEAEYNQALLEKCQALAIKIIGLADHASVDCADRVDALRQQLEPHGIVVFPGFEIASTEKIHMVCLFPEGTSKDQLNQHLGRCQLPEPDSEGKIGPSSLSCVQLAETIKTLGGFWYAAHATLANGLLFQKSAHIWRRGDLVKAAQIPGSVEDLPQEFKNIVLNKDSYWKRERLIAVINAKDVAKPSDMEDPGATCWVKMTKPTFEAFKVAFLDPESRIRLNSQQQEEPTGEIVSMNIAGGYLDGVHIVFSKHLNTVIGGRGTGKSTLLECLRYVLAIPPKGLQAQRLHQEIIKENLGKASGRIELELLSSAQHGKRYKVTRRYGEMPIVRDKIGNVSTLLPRDLLPSIEIYGQNEIYELAQDEQSRSRLLERFLPNEGEFGQRRALLRKRLQENQQKLLHSLGELDDLQAQMARLPNLTEQLRGFEALGIQEKLSKTPLFARERQITERAAEELLRLRDGLENLQGHLPDLTFISDAALENLPNAALIRPLWESLETLRQHFLPRIAELQSALAEGDQQFAVALASWQQALQQGEAELEKALRSLPATAGKSGQEVGTAYQRLLQDIERIKPLEARIKNFDKLRASQQQERCNLLAELSDLRGQRSESLGLAVKRLNRTLDGKLKVEVVAEADRASLKQFLLESKLEGVGEKRLSWVDESETVTLTPSALAQAIREDPARLVVDWGLTPMVAEALAKLPPSRLMELESLELDDRVNISLNVSHDQTEPVFRPLDKLSTGQQCTAILHMLLLENVDPLIMDQPEDNLDNAFIAERIVHELRAAKTRRQFLFATHNANIPVFGDAEWIGVFTTTEENHGSLNFEAQGSIDVPVIRDQVANILEGGRDAFIQRKEKYEF